LRHTRIFSWSVFAFAIVSHLAYGVSVVKPVAVPSAEGTIVGAAFSPDSRRLAVARYVAEPPQRRRHTLQIVDLKSGRVVVCGDVLGEAFSDLTSGPYFVRYSPDGEYLLLAKEGSDVLRVVDAATLQVTARIALHPESESRNSPSGQRHLYFQGVASLAVASRAEIFGALTHDEIGRRNELFVGSFRSGGGRIINHWGLTQGRVLPLAGLSLNDDGSRVVTSMVPNQNRFPGDFDNLRLYESDSGKLVESIHTDGLVDQIVLLPDESVLASRADAPSIFSKKACIEKWNFGSGKLTGQFCDQGRNVVFDLGVSLASARIVGCAYHLRKDLEGHVNIISGRVDVWDMNSGDLVARSEEMPRRLLGDIQISADGSWVMVGQTLLQLLE